MRNLSLWLEKKLPAPVAEVPSLDDMIQCFQTAGNLWGEGLDTDPEDYGIDPQADILRFQMKELRALLTHTRPDMGAVVDLKNIEDKLVNDVVSWVQVEGSLGDLRRAIKEALAALKAGGAK